MTPEAIEAVYREGFAEGATQASQYVRGSEFRDAEFCWADSEAKAELDKTDADADRSAECVARATRIVLDQRPSRTEPRKPL